MRPIRTGRRAGRAYPLVVLVLALLASGCAADRRPAWRPSPPPTPGVTTPATTPATAPTATTSLRYVFPVAARAASYHPTHAAYPGTDIFADCGTPVLAVTDGRILEVSRVDRFDKRGPRGPFNGGLFVSLLGDDGVRYYGSHLSEVAPGIEAGVQVRAGHRVGRVGRTGNANNVCHLHFGISPPCQGADGWWIRRGVVWPAPYLDAWRRHVDKGAATEVAAWHRRHGCPKAP